MHPGLLLDKPHDPSDWWRRDDSYVRERLTAVSKAGGDESLLQSLHERRDKALAEATRFKAKTAGPLALHLSRANAFENANVCLHSIYGFAYIPGSGLKGMARAFATLSGEPEALIEEVFGRAADPDSARSAGAVVFHDAWPTRWPKLEVDITNCHHRHYYDGKGDENPPEDWEDPVPVNFLAVKKGAEFTFALSARSAADERHRDLCRRASAWLQSALAMMGAGAKTNAGYGRFVIEGERPADWARRQVFEATITLVTPAFLAGALQEEEDCDLRPGTLRGLLRWWWRTLHAGRLPVGELRRLEGFLWGTTSASGAIALEVIARPDNPGPVSFNQDDIRNQCRIDRPAPGSKVSQGFFYLAYGMQEVRNRDTREVVKPARRFLPQGASWTVRLAATPRKEPGSGRVWTAEQLLNQGRAALIALAQFGGVGAKCRRGYGSISIECEGAIPATIRELLDLAALETPGTASAQGSSSLAHLAGGEPQEFALPGNEPWFALDQLGGSYQAVAGLKKHNQEKMALGLPRKIDDPRGSNYIRHPRWRLVPGGGAKDSIKIRHASPLHFKIFQRDGRYFVRVTAFADPFLPDAERSAKFLSRILGGLSSEIKSRASIQAPAAKPQGGRMGAPSQPPGRSRPAPKLSIKQKTTGILVEQNKKGTWKAKECSTGEMGPIQNSKSMPGDVKAGDTVALIVKINNPGNCAFDWIKED